MRQILCWIVLFVLAGCRAPAPTGNWLAPFGSTRVPPPATGSYGAPDVYYPGPTKAPQPAPKLGGHGGTRELDRRGGNQADNWQLETVSQSVEAAAAHDKLAEERSEVSAVDSPTLAGSLPASTTASKGSVRQVSFSDASSDANRTTIRIVDPQVDSTSVALQLKGMHVNDATAYGKPSPFFPSGQLVELPQPAPATELTATAVGSASIPGGRVLGTPPAAIRQLEPIDPSGWKPR